MSAASGMDKAFSSVRGALRRGALTELRCKKLWLDRVIKDLPGTAHSVMAQSLLPNVEKAIEASSGRT